MSDVIKAVIAGDVKTVKEWLSRTRYIHHEQLLMMRQVLAKAAKLGHTSICQVMLNTGKISPEAASFALLLACENNQLLTAKQLIKYSHVDMNSLSEMRSRACLNGHTCIVEWLTRDIMNLSPADVTRWKLISACARGDVSMVEDLVTRVTTDVEGVMSQALRIACYTSNLNVAQWLTSHTRVDVDSFDSFSEIDDELTLLMRMRRSGTREPQPVPSATHVMLSGCCRRETALHAAIGTEISSDASLHAACFNGDIYTATQLVYECDVNLQLTNGCTSLHYACARGDKEVVQVLLSAFAKTDVRDENRHTPAMTAAIHGNFELPLLVHLYGASTAYEHRAFGEESAIKDMPYVKKAFPVSMVNEYELTHADDHEYVLPAPVQQSTLTQTDADVVYEKFHGSSSETKLTKRLQYYFKAINNTNLFRELPPVPPVPSVPPLPPMPRSRYDHCCNKRIEY